MIFPDHQEIVILDTEFHFAGQPGNRPVPVCLCAMELRSGRRHRIWCEDLPSTPNPLPPDALYVAYSASAEWGCYLALGWPLPKNVCDLYFEFRCLTNGLQHDSGSSLLDALAQYGIKGIARAEKQQLRTAILEGGPYDATSRAAILDYCFEDVETTRDLLEAMHTEINLPAALERGRYSRAVAWMEWSGIPVDVPLLRGLQEHWREFRTSLIESTEREHRYNVYRPVRDGYTRELPRRIDALNVVMIAERFAAGHRCRGTRPKPIAQPEDRWQQLFRQVSWS